MARGEPKIIIHGNKARDELLRGAKAVYKAVAATYGPTSGNVALQRNYGYATITHDGVTVAREVYLRNENQDIGAGLLVQASSKSNETTGDGTSATVILGYNVMEKGRQRIAAGFNAMGLRRGIDKASEIIKAELDKLAVPVADKDLHKVASISATDPEIGQLVADTVVKVGGVGITVEEFKGLGIVQDMVEGLYFEKGWDLPHFVTDRATEEAIHENVSIMVVEKKMKQNQDIVPILKMVDEQVTPKTLLIIGHVDGQALETCALTNLGGGIRIVTVKPPVYGDQELPFLEDVAAMTGAKLVPSSMTPEKVTKDYLGKADKVIVAKDNTTILGGEGDLELIQMRIDAVNKQLKSPKYSAMQRERMEMRLAKLQGQIGIIRVGGATESGIKEMKFRVEDAIAATRAAKAEGIVPGGATTLARLSKDLTIALPDKNEQEGAKLVLEALAEPFKRLIDNAGDDGSYRIRQLLASPAGHGFDVKKMTDEPIDLLKASILDPVKVIKSVVENACEVAGIALTIPTIVTIDRDYVLEQVQINRHTAGGQQ